MSSEVVPYNRSLPWGFALKTCKQYYLTYLSKNASVTARDDLRPIWLSNLEPLNRSVPWGFAYKHVKTSITTYFSKNASPHGTLRFKSYLVEQFGALKSVRAVRICVENKFGAQQGQKRSKLQVVEKT